jgi:imidazolonepropionase-like amidohydrolase
MKPHHLIAAVVLVLTTIARASDNIPAKPETQAILFTNAEIHTVSGDVVHNGQLLIDKGRIVAIGQAVDASAGVQRVDCSGKRIYPGLIDSNSELGLVEIDAVRATRDQSEAGSINPNAHAEVAVNPDSELIPVARSNGVLLALVAPGGGVISGTSGLVQLDGWTWEDMTLKSPIGMHVNWPSMSPRRGWRFREPDRDQLKKRDDDLKIIRDAFESARAYRTARSGSSAATTQPDFDARWEAMMPLLDGKMPLIVEANDQQQIQSAVAFAVNQKLRLIILGGYDAPRCAELLKKYDVPVIVDGVQRLPTRRGDAYDDAFTVPARLKEAGVRFCIAANRSASMARNLPYHAATAAAFGLSPEDAVKSITLWPAQILGVSDRVGALEVDKDATLIVCDGDILEEPTHVERAFIQGREIDLTNKQTRLYDKYREKYRRQGTKD